MIKDWNELAQGLSKAVGQIRTGAPEAMKGFSAMARAATAQGALDAKTKELMALALGIAARCDGCLAFHAKAVYDLGGSREEVMETIAMSVYMGGGPSLMYGALALDAYDQVVAAAPPEE
ncbi:carboxymuconolactone decarboxylase [Paramagnetospirillum kuznetsovii]|uniref:Carboxymuconolactone decarboxylase n=1 Tax=Paramagnetospirillum kuznetsovii TaxID=2053833 RepID=A0A364P1R9_9PROT|nr:carboxymuconolactone decarboxylase family protein [Paramagnetospirillum kuznetsovii]RAU23282.1 carboxymuconolactone decarboxylase [Paramagnetospirillum kuznetsovii]